MPRQTIGSLDIRTFPLPPEGFDPLAATAEELRQHGFPRRPDPQQLPHEAAKWVTKFRDYQKFTHITPEFTELSHHRSAPNRRTEKGTEGMANATSYNWSGSVLFIGGQEHFTWIYGSWTVPHVYPTPGAGGTEYGVEWLGIDGDGSDDVMQAGTYGDTNGTYYAWFEWFPYSWVQISNFPVSPGDVVYLLLCADGSNNAMAWMQNLTSRVYTSFAFSAPAGTALVGNCAEAVVERPGINGSLAELPRYGEVFFDDVTAYSNLENGYPIGLGTPISMLADDGVTVISTPVFEADTDSIKVSYVGP